MILTLGWILHWIVLGYGFGRWAAVRWVFLLAFSLVMILASAQIPDAVANWASQHEGEPHIAITLGLFVIASAWGRANAEGTSVGAEFENMVRQMVRDFRIWRRLREARKINREQGY